MALVGVGNELNGDDAAGVLVIRILARLFTNQQRHTTPVNSERVGCASVQFSPMPRQVIHLRELEVMLVEGGIAPEAFSGPLRRFAPQWVVLVDAAAMQEEPGTLAWVDWRLADGLSATTHTMPPTMLAKYLIHEIGCQIGLVGIQPESVEMDAPLDGRVAAAVETAAADLYQALVEIGGESVTGEG